jgi:hypothetical protein
VRQIELLRDSATTSSDWWPLSLAFLPLSYDLSLIIDIYL